MTEPSLIASKPRRAIRFQDLALGLIPVFSGLALVGALAYQTTRPLNEHYKARAEALLKAGQYSEAQACLRRLLSLDPSQPDIRFSLAQTQAAGGQMASAVEIMRALADPSGGGFLPAHFWLAQQLSALAPSSPEHAKEAEAHLLAVLKEYPKSAIIKRSLGLLHARIKQPNKALPYLLDVANDDPEVLLTIARCYQDVNDAAGAVRFRREAIKTARALTEKEPKAPAPWLFWGQALAGLGEYPEAYEILDRGASQSGAASFGTLKAALCEEWSRVIVADPKRSSAAKLEEVLPIVERGLSTDPNHEGLAAIANILALLADPEGTTARRRFVAIAERGKPVAAAAAARLVLGNAAMARQRPAEAFQEWAAGYGLDPSLTVLANNYAWALAHAEQPEPAKALEVIDKALSSRPGDPRLLGTRGLVLLRLGRSNDAKAELTRALAGGNTHQEVKAALTRVSGPNKPEPSS